MDNWIEEFFKLLFPIEREKLNIEPAYVLKDRYLPASIYKYREINKWSIQNLEDDTVWLSYPQSFNDPYDCSFNVDFFRLLTHGFSLNIDELIKNCGIEKHLSADAIILVKKSSDPFNTLLDQALLTYPEDDRKPIKEALSLAIRIVLDKMATSNLEEIKNSYKLCSFSQRNDSILMWSHYADSHKGFCIEYDLSVLKPSDYRRRFLYPVVYSDNLYDATEYYGKIKDGGLNNLYLTIASLYKATDWQYEKEWRLIFAHGILPNEQAYYMGTPKAILLGSQIKNEKVIIEIGKKKNVPIYKMELSKDKFELVPKPIL